MDLSVMGLRIKSVRLENKLTLEKLSEKLGISRNFLWEIEAGRKAPAIQTLFKIGKELNISLDYILGLSPTAAKLSLDKDDDISKIEYLLNSLTSHEVKILYNLLETYTKNR